MINDKCKMINAYLFSQKKLFLAGLLCIGCMVVVFSTAQTLGRTLKAKIMNQGTEGNMIVVDAGADTPMFSTLPPETYDFVRTVPHIARQDGELMVTPCLQLASLVLGHFTTVRGVDPVYYKMYDQYRLVEGRLPTGKNEVMIGTLLSAKVKKDFNTGDVITFEGKDWKIVGLFEDRQTVMGSGIVARLEDIQHATNREHISFVSLRADSHEHMEAIREYIKKTYDALLVETPEVPGVIVEPEVEYYLDESEAINPLIMFFNLVNVLYLVVGAMIIYNIMDSICLYSTGHINLSLTVGSSKGMIAAMSMAEIAMMASVGGVIAAIAAQFIGHISINFMMMTFYLEISVTTILWGILLSALMALFAAAVPVKKAIAGMGSR
jgi:ABC-type antimicrobial peptide transport system permease subunit